MPTNPKKGRIITVAADKRAQEVADGAVAPMVTGANVVSAMDVMAGDFMPDDTSVVANDVLNFVTAELTDKEADQLAQNPDVVAVEDDEEVFALDDGFGDDTIAEFDPDAAVEVDGAADGPRLAVPWTDEDAVAAARIAETQPPSAAADIDFDEAGRWIALSAASDPSLADAGLSGERLVKFATCVVKCAFDAFAAGDAPPDAGTIEALMARQLGELDASTASALRDFVTCGLQIIFAPHAWRFSTGAGVRVAVLDTGIANAHPDLTVWGGVSYVPGVTSWNDDHGHGTHVAGTIAARRNGIGVVGVAPDARLYAVKVLNRNGSGQTSWILNGLAWCLRHRMHVANLSLGSGASTHATRVFSVAYETAGRALRFAGILPVAAAGNSGLTSSPFVGNPARCPSYLAVASVGCNRVRSGFSSFGPQVELAAPGADVWSTVPARGYARMSGTSMAAPHVAGVAALVKRRYPGWSADRIRVHLWRTAIDLGPAGRDWLYGFGLVHALRAVR